VPADGFELWAVKPHQVAANFSAFNLSYDATDNLKVIHL